MQETVQAFNFVWIIAFKSHRLLWLGEPSASDLLVDVVDLQRVVMKFLCLRIYDLYEGSDPESLRPFPQYYLADLSDIRIRVRIPNPHLHVVQGSIRG